MSMSFLRLRHPPLEPDSGEETTSEADPTSPIPPYHRTIPSIPQPLPLMNRSKSEDPPGTSFILTNRTRITTYDTAVEEEDDEDDYETEADDTEEVDGSSSFKISTSIVEVQPSRPPPAVLIKRNDPPEFTGSTLTQQTPSVSSTSSSLIPQTKKCHHVPTEVVPKAKLDVPLKKFDKDRNLISNAPLDGPTRSPEVTLVADSSTSNQVFSKEQNDQHWNHPPTEEIQESNSPETNLVIPSLATGLDNLSHEIHRSVHFSNVHIHEHIILDTSGDSESSFNFVVNNSSPHVVSPNKQPPLKSSRTQNDPPPSVLSLVSTVDEYEAQREPHRRRLKEEEKRSGKSNAPDSRSEQLRRILSLGTTATNTTTSFLIHDNISNYNNNNTVALNNASDYVSVQELVPKEQSRIGATRTEEPQPPLSQNANDIFEAYQQSFIGSEQGDYPPSTTAATTTGNSKKSSAQKHQRRPRPINRRSISAPVVSKSQQQPQEGRGLFRRFFPPKKDPHIKIEI